MKKMISPHEMEFQNQNQKGISKTEISLAQKNGLFLISCSRSSAAVEIADRKRWLMNLATLSVQGDEM